MGKLKDLNQEKQALMEQWSRTSGQEKIKLLVRLMDIDDELAELGGGDRKSTQVPSLFKQIRNRTK